MLYHHYDDHRFQQIIDEFILSSNDKQLSNTIRNIDYEATKLGISFYQMMFILIQKEVIENNRRQRNG
jgi:hypothetical protein